MTNTILKVGPALLEGMLELRLPNKNRKKNPTCPFYDTG